MPIIDDYGYEFAHDPKYCYPNSSVLRNKLNITNREELEEAERQIGFLRANELRQHQPDGSIDLDYLKLLHKKLFGDIYPWAGQFRTVNISKGNSFCDYEYLESEGKRIFKELADENYLLGIHDKDKMADRLGYYLGELNVLHPFREGNGRTQRLIVSIIAERAGYRIKYSLSNRDEMIRASIDSFNGDYTSMDKLMCHIVVPISDDDIDE